jgi:pimeloyl-ACP methyl ester carboxylesterase
MTQAPPAGLHHTTTTRRHLETSHTRASAKGREAARMTAVTLPSSGVWSAWTQRTLRHLVKTSRVVLLVASCLHAKANVQGEFVPKKNHWQNPRGFNIPNPKSKAVLLFLHGSLVEKLDDTCDPNGEATGFSVPEVVRGLAGAQVSGMEVIVFAPCHGRATAMGEPLKIDQRVTSIDRALKELGQSGVDPSQIFLVGHSAGGWAALLHGKRHPGSVNAVVAFAPAFAGKKRFRSEVWQRRHEEQTAEIQSAARIPALVFAFDNDEYNTPEDLAFLSGVKDATLLRVPDKAIGGMECEIPLFSSSHSNAYRKCFSSTQSEILLEFLRARLDARAAPLANIGQAAGQ